jgi:peptidylprolyl isomerase
VRKTLLAVALTAALAGCGGSSGGELLSDQEATPTGSPAVQGPAWQGPVAGSPGASLGGCTNQPPPAGLVAGTTDLSKKPQVEVPDTPPPCNLLVGDIVRGSGPAAKDGDQLTMKYVGVLYATGKQFDASWDRGADFPFTLGGGNVIQGWDKGMVGMKAGGRRQLIIPPELGYGDQGAGADIPPGATLIFVVDLVKIG